MCIDRKKQQLRYFLFVLYLLLPVAGYAQTLSGNFPAESLPERMIRIARQTGTNIVFDENKLKDIQVPALNANGKSIDQALESSLSSTAFTYRKRTDGGYVIYEKTTENNKPDAASGSLRGRVVESSTSEPLPGAMVKIAGTNLITLTNSEGYYTFPKVPGGRQTIEVSFIGYLPEKTAVRIQPERTGSYDIKMTADSKQLGEVVVSGIQRMRGAVPHTTEKALVAEIKSAQSVLSGISSEQIGKSADRNAAEAIRRISGVSVLDNKFVIIRGLNPRYNLTYLNDNIAPSTELYSRAFALDLIPSRIIDRILVQKTASPDLMGDMAGGAVKIYTKEALAVKHFDIEVMVGVRPDVTFSNDFLSHKGSSTDFLGFDNGLRKLPDVVPGYGDFTRARISQTDYVDNFSNTISPSKTTALPDVQLNVNYYNAWRIGDKKILSMLSSLSYKRERNSFEAQRMQSSFIDTSHTHDLIEEIQSTENAQINLLQNFTLSWNEKNKFHFKNFIYQQGEKSTVYRTILNNRIYGHNEQYSWERHWYSVYDDRNIILNYSQRFLYSGNLAGEHQLGSKGKHKLNWNTGINHSLLYLPDQRMIRLNYKRNNIYINLPDNPLDTDWIARVRGRTSASGAGPYYDVARGIISRTWTRNSESIYDFTADYNYQFNKWMVLRAGTYQQWKQRNMFRRVYTLNEGDVPDAGYPNDDIIGMRGNVYMDFNRILFRERDLPNVWSYDYIRDDGAVFRVIDRTSGSDAYIASEQNNSGYAALNLTPFRGKLDIYGGLRVEYDRQKVAGAIPEGDNTGGGLNVPILVDIKKTSWLPSLNLSYKPSEEWVIRGAYAHTINRPEFREISPFSDLDILNNQNIVGNPKLQPAHIIGYDLRVEWYPGVNQGNTFSVGVFYKDFTKPIERTTSRNLYTMQPVTISFANADKATLRGLEIDARQSLSFIPWSFLRNFSVIANLALIDSRINETMYRGLTSIPYRNVTRQMQGQSPYLLNAGLYYDNPNSGTKAALIFNEVGERIYAVAHGMSFLDANTDENGEWTEFAQSGSSGSILELAKRQLDFSFTQRIGKGLQLKFSIQNILNSPIRLAEDENFTYRYEPARLDILDEGNGDAISGYYRTGQFFTLNLMYSF